MNTGHQLVYEAKPIGATATIVWLDYLNYGLEIDKSTAHVLLGAILSDTYGLTGSTTTGADRQAVTDLAMQCGLYHDFGLIKMNFDRLLSIRDLFEKEQALYELHTVSGHDDLAARPSTEHLADTALGHHRWYNGAGGYPENYVRNESPYRQMTDLAAIASVIADAGANGFGKTLEYILSQEGKRFSPVLTAYLDAEDVQEKIKEIL